MSRRVILGTVLCVLTGACGYFGRPLVEGPVTDAPAPIAVGPGKGAGPGFGGFGPIQASRIDIVDPASGQPAVVIQAQNGSAVILVKVRGRWKQIDLADAAARLAWAADAGPVEVLDVPPRVVLTFPPE